MYTMATAARVVTDWAGDPGAVVDYGVRFTRPVVVPDPGEALLRVVGVVRAVRDDGLVEVDLTATVDGQTVLAKARVIARSAVSEVTAGEDRTVDAPRSARARAV